MTQPATPQLPIEVWQLVMDTVSRATNYETFYSDHVNYRSWALVSRAWGTCAQTVLFHTTELLDKERLHRFIALLDDAPHLAPYVKTLRLYSRHMHIIDNVFGLLPLIPKDRLPKLTSILLTRITEQDTWHPQLYLSYVTFQTFSDLTRVLDAFANLRVLSCLDVRWCELGALPECLAGTEVFLPKLEDLTILYMGLHEVERLLSALGRSSSLKELYVDCPHYHPFTIWTDPRKRSS
ncbi:hypothetical protein BD310DRAFT_816996 [Dichomitus squalens]|uniref:F-box domain-containing protein n=1 Tax=Dichomitus squalens TaxID=114155 RepID=A0A4Q9PXU7_9APHY|nr:hypothetical protein BD310DRAFT_816996 [Dichomitus squalens]